MKLRVVKSICQSTVIGLVVLMSNQAVASSMTVDSHGGLKVFDLNNPNYWFTFSGRLYADSVLYSGDQTKFPSGSTIRSAKLSFKGGVGNDWVYKLDILEADRANRRSSLSGGAALGEAFLAYNGFDTIWLAFGQVSVPSGLDSGTSAGDLPFMEQSLPGSAFGAEAGIGINFTWEGEYLNFSASLVHPKAGTQQGFLESFALSRDPLSFGGRLTLSPVHNAHLAYHAGFTYRHHNLRDLNDFNFSTKPELRSRQSPNLTTNIFNIANIVNPLDVSPADKYYVLDWEVAGRKGPLMLAAEYFYTQVKTKQQFPDLNFNGYYVMGSYVLTGETRPYDLHGATFGGVKPRCKKTGAWEISARHSYVKLLDSVSTQTVFVALDDLVGNAYTTTIGLTWWVNENVRFLANYSHMNYVDLHGTGGVALPNRQVDAFGVRGQISW